MEEQVSLFRPSHVIGCPCLSLPERQQSDIYKHFTIFFPPSSRYQTTFITTTGFQQSTSGLVLVLPLYDYRLTESTSCFQFIIEATDGHMYFPQFAYATMRVFVDRNVYPTITNLGVAIDVDEATVMGSQIYAVNAFDADLLDGVSLPNFFC